MSTREEAIAAIDPALRAELLEVLEERGKAAHQVRTRTHEFPCAWEECYGPECVRVRMLVAELRNDAMPTIRQLRDGGLDDLGLTSWTMEQITLWRGRYFIYNSFAHGTLRAVREMIGQVLTAWAFERGTEAPELKLCRWRVAWKIKGTGTTGHGEAYNWLRVRLWVEAANAARANQERGVYHWVEEVPSTEIVT